jgi:hypothetical protein
LLDSWEGKKSEEKLKEILGQNKAEGYQIKREKINLYLLAATGELTHAELILNS